MKVKTFILTFLMMMSSPFLFGQKQNHFEPAKKVGTEVTKTITAKVILNGKTITNADAYELVAFCDDVCSQLASFIEDKNLPNDMAPVHYVTIDVHNDKQTGDVYFKLWDGSNEYVSENKISWNDEIWNGDNGELGDLVNLYEINFKSVAQIEGNDFDVVYPSLPEAVNAAEPNATVTLLTAAEGAGLKINKNITIDLGKNLYTINKAVGSTGTESQGFQLLKGNDVTIQNGTVAVKEKGTHVVWMFNAYANLTLEGITVDCANMDGDEQYVVVANNGGGAKPKVTLENVVYKDFGGQNPIWIDTDTKLVAGPGLEKNINAEQGYNIVYKEGTYSLEKYKAHFKTGAYARRVENKKRDHFSISIYDVNAKESLVLKVYHNDELLVTTTYRETDEDNGTPQYPIVTARGKSITANNVVNIIENVNKEEDVKASGSWDNVWHVTPTVANVPNRYEVYVDGNKTDELDLRESEFAGFSSAENLQTYLNFNSVYKQASVTTKEGKTTYYATLQAAFAAAKKSDVITLLDDVTLTEQIQVGDTDVLSDITLNGNKKTITASLNENASPLYFGNSATGAWATGVKINDLTVKTEEGTKARFGIFLGGGTSSVLNNIKVEGDYYYYGINLYGTHGATMTNCDVVTLFTNAQDANPLKLEKTHIGHLYANKSDVVEELPKVFADDETVIDTLTFYAESTIMIDKDAIDNVKKINNAVAECNRIYYRTFDAAFEASQDDDVINIVSPASITQDKTYDLKERTITYASTEAAPAIRILANVTVKNGTMTTTNDEGNNYCFIVGNKETAGTLTIESGLYDASKGGTSAVQVTNGTLKIKGGEFKSKEYNGDYRYLINCADANYNNGSAKVEITGGRFHNWNPQNNAAEGANTNFCADGHTAKEVEPYVWEVFPAIARIGEDDIYPSFDAAIKAAKDGDVITLLTDIKEIVTITNKKLTIDGGGFNYTGRINTNVTSDYPLTFKNFNIDGAEYYFVKTTDKSGGDLTFDNCNIKNSNGGLIYTAKSTNSVTIKNSIVDNCNYGIGYFVALTEGIIDNVIVTNSPYAFMIQNQATHTVTIKNSDISAKNPNDLFKIKENSGSAVITVKFEGVTDIHQESTSFDYIKIVADAQIGTKIYGKLADAFAAAEKSDVIKLLDDVTLTEQIQVENTDVLSDITLNGNNKTITASLNENASPLYFGNSATGAWATGVKIKDLTVKTAKDTKARFGIFLCGGTSSVLNNIKVEGDYLYGINLYGTHGATMTNCHVVTLFTNAQDANPLKLENTHIGHLYANESSVVEELPKVFADDETVIDTLTFWGESTIMIDKEAIDNVKIINEAVAECNRIYYKTFDAAFEASGEKDVINIVSPASITQDKVYDLENRTINYASEAAAPAIRILANVTVKNATMTTTNNEGNNYCFIVGNKDTKGSLTIESGLYDASMGGTSAVQVTNGTLNIKGGEFKSKEYNGDNRYLINCADANYNNGSATVEITGGRFHNWNPQNNAAEGANTNFCADGYAAKEVEPKVWEVFPAIARIGEVYYATLQDAINAVANGETIELLSDCAENVTIVQTEGVSFTIDGKTGENTKVQYTGTINIDGNNGYDRNETLAIKNIKFYNEDRRTSMNVLTFIKATTTTQSHNVTVENCDFIDNYQGGRENYVKGANVKEGNNWKFINCTDNEIMMNIIQYNGNSENLVVEGGTIKSRYGINIGNSKNGLFKGITFESGERGFTISENADEDITNTLENISFTNVDTPFAILGTGTRVFNIEGNITSVGYNSFKGLEIAKFVLTTKESTFQAPELKNNVEITNELTESGYILDYSNGVYSVIEGNVLNNTTGKKYATLQEAIDEAKDGEEIVVLKDIDLNANAFVNIDGYNTYFKVEGKTITIDLNGNKISGVYNETTYLVGVFSTNNNGHLTLEDNVGTAEVNVKHGTDSSIVYAVIANYGPDCSITINGGAYILDESRKHGNSALIYSDPSVSANTGITVNGGRFELGNVNNTGYWIFNVLGAEEGHVDVFGGTFNANVFNQSNRFEVQTTKEYALCYDGDEAGTWTVVQAVAWVDNQRKAGGQWYIYELGYATLAEAFKAAEECVRPDYTQTVEMLQSVELTEPIVVEKDVKLALNGMNISNAEGVTFYPIIRVQNGATVTIDGDGTIDNALDYVFVLGSSDKQNAGNLVINGGKFTGNITTASVTKGTLTINGGEFATHESEYGADFLINCIDESYKADEANVIISGGTFHGFNPEDNAAEGANTNFCAEGFGAVDNGDGTYTVMPLQEQSLVQAWNWFSTYLDIDVTDLTKAIGDNGTIIKNQKAGEVAIYMAQTNRWYVFEEYMDMDHSQMYMINVNDECSLRMAANVVNAEEYTITLSKGWSWIGYPSNQDIDINVALANIPEPKDGDRIKSQYNGFAEYRWGQWRGSLTTLVPGIGYMYNNKSNDIKEFKYAQAATRGTVKANVTSENNYWTPNTTKYPYNMTMTAVVEGMENANYEVAAFVNGEVRGSARPIYIEPMDAHILFITIHGEDVEEMTFRLYDIDTDTEYELNDRINYSNNAELGSIAEPYMLTRGTTGIGEAAMSNVNIYPNPTTTGTEINLDATCDKVEVFNALGVKVVEYQNVDSIDALETAGIYVIRITNNGNVQNCRLVVK